MISKSVFDPIIAEWGKRNRGMMYTVEVNKEELSALPSSFLPSMVQEKLEKKYELRIFYLNGKMYPMAIFSQKDNQTQLDFRNYNWEKPNRMEPCKLNVDLKKKNTQINVSFAPKLWLDRFDSCKRWKNLFLRS